MQLVRVLDVLEGYVGYGGPGALPQESGRLVVEDVELIVAPLVPYVQAEALLGVEPAEELIVCCRLGCAPLRVGEIQSLWS